MFLQYRFLSFPNLKTFFGDANMKFSKAITAFKGIVIENN